MIPDSQFLREVVIPTLEVLDKVKPGLNSNAAQNLLVGTAIQESHLSAYHQKGGGPALSFFQIEPATFEDIYFRYLHMPGKVSLLAVVDSLVIPAFELIDQLDTNQHFACAIARLRYWMSPAKLPDPDDIAGLAAVWKTTYNAGGKGHAAEFVANYRQFVLEE